MVVVVVVVVGAMVVALEQPEFIEPD